MPATLAYPWLYRTITTDMDADEIDDVDAILGDVAAEARVNQRGVDLILASGGEIG